MNNNNHYELHIETLVNANPHALLVDGHNNAVIGLSHFDGDLIAAYSLDLIANNLVEMGMTVDEADEYIAFNIVGAYMGDYGPIYIDDRIR